MSGFDWEKATRIERVRQRGATRAMMLDEPPGPFDELAFDEVYGAAIDALAVETFPELYVLFRIPDTEWTDAEWSHVDMALSWAAWQVGGA